MDRVLAPRQSHRLVGLPPFNPLQPLYNRWIHNIGPLSHRGIIRILMMSTTYETLEFLSTPSYALGGGVLGTPSWILLHIP